MDFMTTLPQLTHYWSIYLTLLQKVMKSFHPPIGGPECAFFCFCLNITLKPRTHDHINQISSAVRVVSNRGNRYIRCRSGACKGICGFPRCGGKKLKHQRCENEVT
ncbi:hypothetical protein AVEN_262591-1 [Araneus ventricosus]|uniref:Uncharacterized protein n=1 Tax=Araneus ventricosus TaxID=182803 RepID=A0A4Y2HIK6_ARAVE|nr:hypothetical protein AVEN_262591-1 [Araneus ventricosus]